MIIAVDIFDEVEADVTALNGEIVRRALLGHCCHFVDNQAIFADLLNYYSGLRLRIHRIIGAINGRWNWRQYRSDRLYDELHGDQIMAAETRRKLSNYWPCAACICLYNPTNRTRRFPSLIS